jgi:hypothetical protein
MIKKLASAVFMFGFSFVLVATPVRAQDAGPVDAPTTSEAVESESDREAQRQARIDTYKSKVAEKQTDIQQKRMTGRCEAAQAKISGLLIADKSKAEARIASYERVTASLLELVSKLQAADVDTSTIETAQQDLQAEATAFSTALREYVVVLTDLSELDCVADPDAFQSALTLSRESRASLKAQAESLRSFINNDLKIILQDLRTQLSREERG